jgi:antitoxin PrlF
MEVTMPVQKEVQADAVEIGEAKITSKGQITVPGAVRKMLGLKAGDNRQAALDAQAAYHVGKTDYADDFLALVNRDLGCSATATFDRDAIDFPAFTAVP